jgi:hypothetical protein
MPHPKRLFSEGTQDELKLATSTGGGAMEVGLDETGYVCPSKPIETKDS